MQVVSGRPDQAGDPKHSVAVGPDPWIGGQDPWSQSLSSDAKKNESCLETHVDAGLASARGPGPESVGADGLAQSKATAELPAKGEQQKARVACGSAEDAPCFVSCVSQALSEAKKVVKYHHYTSCKHAATHIPSLVGTLVYRYIPIIFLLYSWGSLFGVPIKVPLW